MRKEIRNEKSKTRYLMSAPATAQIKQNRFGSDWPRAEVLLCVFSQNTKLDETGRLGQKCWRWADYLRSEISRLDPASSWVSDVRMESNPPQIS